MALPNPESLLTRRASAAALTEAGYPTSPATLATLASRGGGPRYRRFGRRVIYIWCDLITWAESRLTPVVTSTAELDIAGNKPDGPGFK
jgi:hypothetical protein